MGVKLYSFDGVVFVDLDKFTQTPELRGKQNEIFNSFDKISSECLYNLLTMKYNPSGNLHAFFYHPLIKDEKQYDEFAMMDLALLACAIKKILGIDLRDEKDTIDISSRLAGAFVGEDRSTDGCYAHRR
jgi:hypothetical protein